MPRLSAIVGLLALGACASSGDGGAPDAGLGPDARILYDGRPGPPDAPPADAPPPDAVVCTGGDLNMVDPASGHCYMAFLTATQWGTARSLCLGLPDGAHLVAIGSLAENTFVRTLVGTRRVWIGANDLVSEMQWVWVTMEPFTAFTYWNGGEPNDDGTEDCAVLLGDVGGRWNDGECGNSLGYVCEQP